MGVHTGDPEVRDGDYFGTAVNRAARVMAIGDGGQVLLLLATAELVRSELVLHDTTRAGPTSSSGWAPRSAVPSFSIYHRSASSVSSCARQAADCGKSADEVWRAGCDAKLGVNNRTKLAGPTPPSPG